MTTHCQTEHGPFTPPYPYRLGSLPIGEMGAEPADTAIIAMPNGFQFRHVQTDASSGMLETWNLSYSVLATFSVDGTKLRFNIGEGHLIELTDAPNRGVLIVVNGECYNLFENLDKMPYIIFDKVEISMLKNGQGVITFYRSYPQQIILQLQLHTSCVAADQDRGRNFVSVRKGDDVLWTYTPSTD